MFYPNNKKKVTVILGIIILLSLLISFFDRALAVALLLLTSIILLVFAALLKAGMKSRKFYLLFFISIFISFSAIMFIHYFHFQPFGGGGGDYELYHVRAVELANSFKQGDFSFQTIRYSKGYPLMNVPYTSYYYTAIIGFIYFLTIPQSVIPELLLGILLSLASATLIYSIVKEVGKSDNWAFIVGLISVFYPSRIFYSSFLLKDSFVIPLALLGLWLAIKLIERFSWKTFLIFFVTLLGLTHFRFYVGYAMMFTFAIFWILFSNLQIKKRVIFAVIFIILLGFIPQISFEQGYMGIDSIKTFLNKSAITYYREVFYSNPAERGLNPATANPTTSNVVVPARTNNPLSFITNYAISFVDVVLGPLPWQMKYLRQFAALLEMIPWYILLYFIVKGIVNAIKEKNKAVFPLVVFSFTVFLIMALFISNLGTATRIRMPAFISLLVLLPFAVKKQSKDSDGADGRIKLAFFLPNLEIGGAEKVTANLLNELDRKKFSPQLILQEKKGYHLGTVPKDILIVNFNGCNLFCSFLKLIKYFHKESPDIFVSVFPRFSVVAIAAKIFSGSNAKIVVIEHSIFSRTATNAPTLLRRMVARFIFPALMRILYQNSEAIICVSRGVANDITKITGLKNKIGVIYNPIVNPEIYELAKEPVNHPWILDKSTPVILAVGRLVKAKDYPTLLNAFYMILRIKQAKLLILGEGNDELKIKRFAERLGISGSVDFLGLQENPYKFMAKSSVFVLSSQQEGFSTVIVEAMACGLPVVSTDCESGPSEIIQDEKNGYLVKVGDSAAMAEKIIKILDNNAVRNKFSENGRIRAKDFTVGNKTQEYEKLFLNIIKSDKPE